MVFWSEGTDMLNGLTHSLVTTAANAHDVTQVSRLLHDQEEGILADAGYVGDEKWEETQDVKPSGAYPSVQVR